MTPPSTPVQAVAANTGTLTIALLALTFSTGLIDVLSYIALGHVFTANMAGNVIFLAFAVSGMQGLSAARSVVSLLAFMAAAICGGIINVRHSGWTQARLLKRASLIEAALLLVATSFAVITGSKHEITPNAAYGLIVLTAVAMGVRNAVVRKTGRARIYGGETIRARHRLSRRSKPSVANSRLPVVALACEQFSHIYRRPRGLFISYPLRNSIPMLSRNRPHPEIDVIVVTDAERIQSGCKALPTVHRDPLKISNCRNRARIKK